jgi:hypothetical protein
MCMHDSSISEHECAFCQGFPRTFESHKEPASTPKGLSFSARLITVCLGVALSVTGLTILRTSRTSSSMEQVAVAGLESTFAPAATEHFHDTLPKIVVPHLAVSIPESRQKVVAIMPHAPTTAPNLAEHSVSIPELRQKVVAIMPHAPTTAPNPAEHSHAEHSHDVLSTIIVPHLVAVSIPKTGKKVVAMAPRDSNGWNIFLPPSDLQHRSPDLGAPFKRWARGEAFGSAEACEHYRAHVISEAASDRDRADGPTDALDYRIKLFTYADCVSAQDLRIAGPPHPIERASLTDADRTGDGWYIFLPPGDVLHRSPDPSAPFRRWTQGEAYDTAEDCEDYRARVISEAASDRDHADGPTYALVYKIKLFSYAECVSAQDRRIKEER